jgi:F420-dependent oxidoreductase-like protein
VDAWFISDRIFNKIAEELAMIEVAIMVEGQDGLNWTRWQRIARTVEDAGYVGLFRSDHFTNPDPPDKDSLELWVSLTWLASHTQRIEFGPVVAPMSFRHPAMTARMAAAVDDLSGGRLILGLGAGWQEREHDHYGLELLSVADRFERLEEGLNVISLLLQGDKPSDFAGKYYHLHEATLLPRPQRPGGPRIMIGGRGPKRTLPLVARYAAEWNTPFIAPDEFTKLNTRLDELIVENGRKPSDVGRTLMTACVLGRDSAEVQRKLSSASSYLADAWREKRILVGEPNEVVDQLGDWEQRGIYRVLLQWQDLDDIDGIETFAKLVLPQLSGR